MTTAQPLAGGGIPEPLAWPPDRALPALEDDLPQGALVVSPDGHWLEPESWIDKMPAKFPDRAPMGMFLPEGGATFTIDGRKLDNPPSYCRFQSCCATFLEDPAGLEQLHRFGWDRVMWTGDYGHPESTIGYTRAAVKQVSAQAGDVEKDKAVAGGKALGLWNVNCAQPRSSGGEFTGAPAVSSDAQGAAA